MTGMKYIGVLLLVLPALTLRAESVYITDKLNIGLHENQAQDSPIVMVFPTGTQLELIRRENNRSYVRTAGGVTGWVDNLYLTAEAPARVRLDALTARNTALEQQLKSLQASGGGATSDANEYAKLTGEHAALQQQYRAEKLKVGELEVTIAELRKRLRQDPDTETLHQEIDSLRDANQALEVKLAKVQGGGGAAVVENAPVAADQPRNETLGGGFAVRLTWKVLLTSALAMVVIGLVAGVYLMDYLNRKRHGGFRV